MWTIYIDSSPGFSHRHWDSNIIEPCKQLSKVKQIPDLFILIQDKKNQIVNKEIEE